MRRECSITNVFLTRVSTKLTLYPTTPYKSTFALLRDVAYSSLITSATAEKSTAVKSERCTIAYSTSGTRNTKSKNTRCIRERTARLPASLSCFLISCPASPLGPLSSPSFIGISAPSDHSLDNFSPK
ncbi:Protein of unknown function [Cotesia congregata]|uniref:Uncharacterized protein n=1 Tax=Cotesia congregata TaxID=51543 RepID=A0A8J2HCJ4_COTCN|nr:Protein of unknown function [Cotesia congregata]